MARTINARLAYQPETEIGLSNAKLVAKAAQTANKPKRLSSSRNEKNMSMELAM